MMIAINTTMMLMHVLPHTKSLVCSADKVLPEKYEVLVVDSVDSSVVGTALVALVLCTSS